MMDLKNDRRQDYPLLSQIFLFQQTTPSPPQQTAFLIQPLAITPRATKNIRDTVPPVH